MIILGTDSILTTAILFVKRNRHRLKPGRPVEKSPSLHGRKSTPTPKFLGTAKAYFVCHIGPNFQISLIYAFIGCPQSVVLGIQFANIILRNKKKQSYGRLSPDARDLSIIRKQLNPTKNSIKYIYVKYYKDLNEFLYLCCFWVDRAVRLVLKISGW